MKPVDLNAIDEPINLTGAELLDLLYADRGLAMALAEYHGIIGKQQDESQTDTARWLKGLLADADAAPCACCGKVHVLERGANLHAG